MEITKTITGSTLEVAIEGRVNSANVNQMSDALSKLDGIDRLVLNLEKLDFITSAGLRAILVAEKAMSSKSGQFVVTHVCDNVMEVFECTGFTDIFTFE